MLLELIFGEKWPRSGNCVTVDIPSGKLTFLLAPEWRRAIRHLAWQKKFSDGEGRSLFARPKFTLVTSAPRRWNVAGD